MKSKTKSKTNNHKNAQSHTSSHSGPKTHSPAHPTGHQIHEAQPSSHASLRSKTCEEVETGGFGSFDESLETSNHCNAQATQFCSNCNMNVCNTHYDSHHRSHDNFNNQRQGQTLFHQ